MVLFGKPAGSYGPKGCNGSDRGGSRSGRSRCIYLCKPGPNIVPEPKPHDPKCWMEEANRWVRGVTKPTLTVTQPTPRRGEWPPAASPDDTRHTMCCWLVSAGQHRSVAAPRRLCQWSASGGPVPPHPHGRAGRGHPWTMQSVFGVVDGAYR